MARKLSTRQLGWVLLDKKHPLKWRKEVLPVGHWEKLDENGDGLSFDADEKLLSHLVDSVSKLRANGVSIPYAKSHDGWELAENKYGEIVGASVGKNSRGTKSFFVDVMFDSESAAKECTKTDSSVGIPDKFFDGKGNEYHHPLRHVAATNAPVIPGLDRWQAIAASFAKQLTASHGDVELGESDMLQKIAQMLGIDIEGMDEAQVGAAIEEAITSLKGGGGEDQEMSEEEGDDDMEFSDDLPEDEEIVGKPTPKSITKTRSETVKMSHSPLVINVVRDNRREQIQSLVERRKIDSATGRQLLASFCGNKRIKLELSEKKDSGEFERTVKLLAKNDPLNLSGRSGKRSGDNELDLECSFGNIDDNIVIKDAERRAEAAKSGALV